MRGDVGEKKASLRRAIVRCLTPNEKPTNAHRRATKAATRAEMIHGVAPIPSNRII